MRSLAWPTLAHASGFCSCFILGFYSDAALLPKPEVAECLQALVWRDGWAGRPHVAKQYPGQEPWQTAGGWSQVSLLKNGDQRHMGKAVMKGEALRGSL